MSYTMFVVEKLVYLLGWSVVISSIILLNFSIDPIITFIVIIGFYATRFFMGGNTRNKTFTIEYDSDGVGTAHVRDNIFGDEVEVTSKIYNSPKDLTALANIKLLFKFGIEGFKNDKRDQKRND